MEFGLHPGILFGLAIAIFLASHMLLRAPLPLARWVEVVAQGLSD